MSDLCIVVQYYIKLDTLVDLTASILAADGIGDAHLIFWADSIVGSTRAEEYRPKAKRTGDFVDAFIEAHGSKFQSVRHLRNERNLGPCKTCQVALDFALSVHDRVVFTEDDAVFARDSVTWFDNMTRHDDFLSAQIWAVAGESIFFDSKGVAISPAFREAARGFAIERRLVPAYVSLNFVPSTCFATNRRKWREFGATRGQPVGDVDVCDRCRDEQKFTLFPVVPRVSDVGMLHPDGHSVAIHSRENVTSVKSTYLTSDDFNRESAHAAPARFTGDEGELWRRTALLEGFDVPMAVETGNAADPPLPDLLAEARCALDASRWAEGRALLDEARVRGAGGLQFELDRALVLLKTGSHQEARTLLVATLDAHPAEDYGRSLLAWCYEAAGDFGAARQEWERILASASAAPAQLLNAQAGCERCRKAEPASERVAEQ